MGSRDTPNRLKLATLWRHVWHKLCTPAGSLNDDCPSPASILSISCCRLGHGALHFHCRGSMAWRRRAAWRRWVAWWRLAWRGLRGGGWHGGGGWGWRGGGWGWWPGLALGLAIPPLIYAPPPAYYYPPPAYYPGPAYYPPPPAYSAPPYRYGYAPGYPSYGGSASYNGGYPGYGMSMTMSPNNCGTPDEPRACTR